MKKEGFLHSLRSDRLSMSLHFLRPESLSGHLLFAMSFSRRKFRDFEPCSRSFACQQATPNGIQIDSREGVRSSTACLGVSIASLKSKRKTSEREREVCSTEQLPDMPVRGLFCETRVKSGATYVQAVLLYMHSSSSRVGLKGHACIPMVAGRGMVCLVCINEYNTADFLQGKLYPCKKVATLSTGR